MPRSNLARVSVSHRVCMLVALLVLTPGSGARAWDMHEDCADKRCAANPHLLGECFEFHGGLRPYNGNPTLRIWRTGTKALLGVLCDEDPIIPANLRSALSNGSKASWDRDFIGDFEVCPFTAEKQGWMQFVCVEKVSNLVVYDRHLKGIIIDERHPVSPASAPH
jgi:hypothetical protein